MKFTSEQIGLKVAVIGGGWFGCHTAAEIKKHSPSTHVTLFEKNGTLFSEISGKFGIRLHAGPHYPRSAKTRQACHQGFLEFLECYPELVNQHQYSDYAHGLLDSTTQPSRVTKQHFASVCEEFGNAREVNPSERNYTNVDYVADIQEPSIVVGTRLRNFFTDLLEKLGVNICCYFEVCEVCRSSETSRTLIRGPKESAELFDHVINATCYHSFLPKKIQSLLRGNIKYYPTTALVYERITHPLPDKPISLIIMDGWFPCLMPYDDRPSTSEPLTKYILTHGKITILGKYNSASEAQFVLDSLNDNYMDEEIRVTTEKEMLRFWPDFTNNFKHAGWIGMVLPKIDAENAFRNAITFQEKSNGVIHIFPGKINNIFEISREVLNFVGLGKRNILKETDFSYIESGILHCSLDEIGL